MLVSNYEKKNLMLKKNLMFINHLSCQGLSELIHTHDLAQSLRWSYEANIIAPIFIADEMN